MFVRKSAETEYVGYGFVVVVVYEHWAWATAVVVIIGNEAWHGICVDAGGSGYWMGQVGACDGFLARLWYRTSDAYAGSFHMTF